MTDSTAPVSPASPPPSVAVSVDGRIAEDKICIDCGYNLRGLKTDGRCPECGGEVAASLRGHELHHASLPWLRSVRRGFRLMRNALLLTLLAVVLGIAVAAVWDAFNPGEPRPLASSIAFVTVLVVVVIMTARGFALSTRLEPRVGHREKTRSARRQARVLCPLAVVSWVAFELLKELGPNKGWVDQVVIYAPLALAVLTAFALAAFVRHAIDLLERTAEEKALKQARQARQVVLLALALAIVTLAINALIPLVRSNTTVTEKLQGTAGCTGDCSSCVTLLFVIGGLELICRMSSVLNRIVTAAEQAAPSSKANPPQHAGSRSTGPEESQHE